MSINRPASKLFSRPIIISAIVVGVICLCLCMIAIIIGVYYLREDTVATITPNSPFTQDLTESNPQTQTWLVMFYFDADDIVLEEDIYFDLNEVELVGSTDRVKMVAQIDRNEEGFSSDGDWTSAHRYYLTQDDDLYSINSQLIADLGEVDMGNSNSLVDFASWAIQSYPADKYVLIMSDHGSGWPGGWSDDSPQDSSGNWIYLNDLASALGRIIDNTGISQFELFGMDACLMSMLEVYNSLEHYTHYAVASQETEPGLGWAFASIMGNLVAQPEMSGADLGRAIVESYVTEDQRILNDEARQRMLSSYGISDEISAGELIQDWSKDITIAAVDLTAMPQLNTSLDNFLYALKNVDQEKVAEARSYTQAFYNVFDDRYPSPYIDLANFADFVVTTTSDQEVIQSTQQLKAAVSGAVIAEKHGDQRQGATGLSIFFPVSELYWDEDLGFDYYTEASRSSASQTLWDDFLAFHYAGQDYGLGKPSRDSRLPAPGAGQVSIEPLTINPTTISPNGTINIQTNITGDQVAQIFIVAMLKHEDRYLAYFIDYIKGNSSQEQNGVVYPIWERTNNKIHINLDWQPAPNGICNGSACAFTVVNPDKYTTDPIDLMYFVEGWYLYTETGEKIEATMYFNNFGEDLIRNIIVNPVGADSVIMPRTLKPQPGDQFIMLDTWWTIDNNGQIKDSYQEGNVLTFVDQPFYFVTGPTDVGEYVVGIMVEDMDGNNTFEFAPLIVR